MNLLRLRKPRLEEKLSWLRLLQASAGVERISFPNILFEHIVSNLNLVIFPSSSLHNAL